MAINLLHILEAQNLNNFWVFALFESSNLALYKKKKVPTAAATTTQVIK
jgi:hypothetical protein